MLTFEQRQHIKLERSRIITSDPFTWVGVCLYCLDEIPEERYQHGGRPKFCCDNHRKRYNAKKGVHREAHHEVSVVV